MLPQNNPDRIRIVFDDHRLVANAGLLLPATLARHLGLRELVDRHLDLGGAPGRANTGDKLLTLVASRAGGRRLHRRRGCAACWWDGRCSRLRGQGALHPFLRSFRWGQVRQLARGSFSYQGDTDYFEFDATSGTTYRIEVDPGDNIRTRDAGGRTTSVS